MKIKEDISFYKKKVIAKSHKKDKATCTTYGNSDYDKYALSVRYQLIDTSGSFEFFFPPTEKFKHASINITEDEYIERDI